LIWLFIKIILGKAHTERVFEEYLAKQVVIKTERRRLKVAMDGEVSHLKPPLIYKSLPKHLAIIAP
jgi:diacylglycerol kinase family enzyme